MNKPTQIDSEDEFFSTNPLPTNESKVPNMKHPNFNPNNDSMNIYGEGNSL